MQRRSPPPQNEWEAQIGGKPNHEEGRTDGEREGGRASGEESTVVSWGEKNGRKQERGGREAEV